MLLHRSEPGLLDELEEAGGARRPGLRGGIEPALDLRLAEQVIEIAAGGLGGTKDGAADAAARHAAPILCHCSRNHDAPCWYGGLKQLPCQIGVSFVDSGVRTE